jgi:hypothetical protein
MACTRFSSDECRVKKQLQQMTDPSRFILNVPGNGSNLDYIEDPHIRIQKWGANLQTNGIDIENNLFGIDRTINRDCLNFNEYQNYNVNSNKVQYASNKKLTTEQSRVILPAWTARDLEQNNFDWLHKNPQENVCIPFHNNLSTRILVKDNYKSKKECVNTDNMMPLSINTGGSNCSSYGTCSTL